MKPVKRGRPPGGKGFVVFLQDDADAWVRKKARAVDMAPGHIVELAIRRMMRDEEGKRPTKPAEKTKIVEVR